MSQERKWLILIHAFDKTGIFMSARILEVTADADKLDRLTLALSEINRTGMYSDIAVGHGAKDVWDMLGKICPQFSHSPPFHTLRVMSFHPAE